jgi:hypothetical protein
MEQPWQLKEVERGYLGHDIQLRQDNQDRMVSGEQWTRWPGQASWRRTARTGQPRQDRTSWTGHLGPDNWDRTAETGRTGQVGLIDNLDRTART